MGALTEAVEGIRAAIPLPTGRQKTYIGWGGEYFGGATRFRLPDEQDYTAKVGDGSGTSLITAAVNWMARELIPVRPVLLEHPADDDGVPRTVRRHPSLELLRNPMRARRAPNGYYDGKTLLAAMALSWVVDGNVYRLKVRSPERRVVQYWYLPHHCIEPIGRGDVFIEYYRYRAGGRTYELDPRDVSHLRFGLDPDNPRRGLAPIRGVLRELFSDEEYGRFSAALIHNFAFPGAVVIPGKDVEVEDKAARDEIRDTFDARFTGEGRGRTVVLSANAEVKFLQWTPQELDLSSLRDVPEERVSSVVGIPAAVLGFGTGLQQVKVGATMRELRSMGWEGALIPFLEAVAANDTVQLLPEFIAAPDVERWEFGWDLSRIAALSEVQLKRAQIEGELVGRRIKTVDEARMALGLPAIGGPDGGFKGQPGLEGAAGDADTTDSPDRQEPTGDEDDEEAKDLSMREMTVVEHVARGRTNKAIADALRTSERTVERHVSRAMRKVGAESRSELVARARARQAGAS